MPSPFWTRHNAGTHTESTQKRPLPEPLELEDGPRSPCSFMPRHSYSMMMSPAVHSGRNEVNNGRGQILVLDGDETTCTQFGNEETRMFDGKVLRSVTTASSPHSTPTSKGFSDAETLISEAGAFQNSLKHLQFRISDFPSDIWFIGLFFILLLLFVTASMIGSDRLPSFGLDSFAFLMSALQNVSVAMELGLEAMGSLLGRAVAKVVKGFLRGYHLE